MSEATALPPPYVPLAQRAAMQPALAPAAPAAPRAALPPLPLSRGVALGLAALAPAALGALLCTLSGGPAPIVAVPAIAFGVIAATSPALYIATTAASGPRAAPTLAAMLSALRSALGAFGLALAGLLLPATFLALSSVSRGTTVAVTSAAIAVAGLVGLRRLAAELGAGRAPALSSTLVFVGWAVATLGIAARLWIELGREVLS